jgi:hypothetical protein
MARNTINVGVDTERLAAALEIIARHANACAAELRTLTEPLQPDGHRLDPLAASHQPLEER